MMAATVALAVPVAFDLPAQPAAHALMAFSRQAGVEVLFPFDPLRAVESSPVVGRYEPADALARLLRGTGFGARSNGRGKFVVAPITPSAGSIVGRLLLSDGRPAAGVRVLLPGTHLSATTDSEGRYHLTPVPPGTYHLAVSQEGYQPLELSNLAVKSARTLTVATQTVRLVGEVTKLGPFLVRGDFGRGWPYDSDGAFLGPREAGGNLDLPRTANDALPYTIYNHARIVRSGAINLNEFLQQELLESTATMSPEQSDAVNSLFNGSENLDLRGFGQAETIVLVDGRRLPDVLTAGNLMQDPENKVPDVNSVPLNLVQQIEVLPVSASALYTGNAVGGIINIILRPDVNATELTTTYTNAVGPYDAPQSSVSLLHGETLRGGALRYRLNASFTRTVPPTEAELGYLRANVQPEPPLGDPLFGATPNVRSANLTPLFGPGTSAVTSVAPGADGTGGLAAFAGREGVRNDGLFKTRGGLADSPTSVDYGFGRRQRRSSYFASVVYDMLPWLQVGLDSTYSRLVINPGYDLYAADLTLPASSPLNPFGQDVRVSLNDTAPLLGEGYNEAQLESSATVLGVMLKLPRDWRISWDTQLAQNIARYRGVAGVDASRWQQLVDQGSYNPLRDTQVHGPPPDFYDHVLVYYGARGRFVDLGNYQTLDATVRATNQSVPLPGGPGALNVGVDYRRLRFDDFTDIKRFGDGSLAAAPVQWQGRTLQRLSVFGELQAPLLPARRLPSWIRAFETDSAVRYISSASSRETNVAPTLGLKVDLEGGWSLRGSVTTSNRYPTPYLSRQLANPSDTGSGQVSYVSIFDPLLQRRYIVPAAAAVNPDLKPEAAVTQTAGLVYQRGAKHRLRVALDFVDTRKTNEQYYLQAQDVMDMESLFPGRVKRDPVGTGPVTSILTGTVNLSWRRSQNWNLSVDYAQPGWAGGTLDLYGRFVFLQRYDRQVLPDSPGVDELRLPDSSSLELMRYRANFGGGWSNDAFGFGLDGHYYGARVLPPDQWASQGSSHIDPFWQFDAYLQSDLARWLPWHSKRFGLRAQLRVNNLFATGFPRYTNAPSGAGVQVYGDWRGRTYSLSLTATY